MDGTWIDLLKSWASETANLFALLGLSGVGLFAAARSLALRMRRKIRERRDQQRFGDMYADLKRLSVLSGQSGSDDLSRLISETQVSVRSRLRKALRDAAGTRLERSSSGTQLTFYQVFDEAPLQLPKTFLNSRGENCADSLDKLRAAGVRVALAGPAGSGKTLFCRQLEREWLSALDTDGLLVTIDAADFAFFGGERRTEPEGSLSWLVGLVSRKHFVDDITPLETHILRVTLTTNTVIVIDALDEIADAMSPKGFETFLNEWVPLNARLLTFRESFYETSLTGHATLEGAEVGHWVAPSRAEADAYIESTCLRIYGSGRGSVRAKEIMRLREESRDLCEITANPLLLTMLVTLDLAELGGRRVSFGSIVAIFVRSSLNRDMREGRWVGGREALLSCLRAIAWRRYSGGNRAFDRAALERIIRTQSSLSEVERGGLAAYLETCPVLTAARIGTLDGSYDLAFIHKSMQDYFVAERAAIWLKEDVAEGADFFSHIDTPEITAFLKDSLSDIAGDPHDAEHAARVLESGLRHELDRVRGATNERTARAATFAAGQMAYYLGMVGDDSAKAWLAELVESGLDYWVERSARIGLAFGGDPAPVMELIERMRNGVESGDFELARKNIAVELGFYGDQPFDPLNPTFDTGVASCANLVGRSVQELEMDVEAPNWRMILFNLVYLSKHRPESAEVFESEVRERRIAIERVLRDISATPDGADCPEVQRLMGYLQTLSGR